MGGCMALLVRIGVLRWPGGWTRRSVRRAAAFGWTAGGVDFMRRKMFL